MPGSHAWPYLGLSNLTIVANQADGLYIGREEKVDRDGLTGAIGQC